MANQANFPDPLNGTFLQRPERVAAKDLNLLHPDEQQILFGTTDADNVEIYVYNPDGTIAGHQTLGPTDVALTLTTLVDNTGTYELLNVDMKDVCNRMGMAPGRYSFVCNFLRDEVGSEAGYKLYISQISDDRTELQLIPITVTPQTNSDFAEWINPSVPREFAAALMVQLFGFDISGSGQNSITPSLVAGKLNELTPLTAGGYSITDRINYAQAGNAYTAMMSTVLSRTLSVSLDLLAADVYNHNVQQAEINGYIQSASLSVMRGMVTSGEIDSRFELRLPPVTVSVTVTPSSNNTIITPNNSSVTTGFTL